jgi:hypothetical protein
VSFGFVSIIFCRSKSLIGGSERWSFTEPPLRSSKKSCSKIILLYIHPLARRLVKYYAPWHVKAPLLFGSYIEGPLARPGPKNKRARISHVYLYVIMLQNRGDSIEVPSDFISQFLHHCITAHFCHNQD